MSKHNQVVADCNPPFLILPAGTSTTVPLLDERQGRALHHHSARAVVAAHRAKAHAAAAALLHSQRGGEAVSDLQGRAELFGVIALLSRPGARLSNAHAADHLAAGRSALLLPERTAEARWWQAAQRSV